MTGMQEAESGGAAGDGVAEGRVRGCQSFMLRCGVVDGVEHEPAAKTYRVVKVG